MAYLRFVSTVVYILHHLATASRNHCSVPGRSYKSSAVYASVCMLYRFGEQFLAMSTAYDPQLRLLANQVADELNMKPFVREGVYFFMLGPCYETIAEGRMARAMGGDVSGRYTHRHHHKQHQHC